MIKMRLGAAVAAALVVGLLGFAGAASADSVRKQCGDEYKAAKAANTLNGQSWSDFYNACKAKNAAAAPAASPTTAAAPTPAATPSPTPTKAAPAPKKTPAAATGAGEFTNEAEAKAHCPTDTVVWVNTKSHKYHFSGAKSYGTTKKGAYMCEADAKAGGNVAAKDEKSK